MGRTHGPTGSGASRRWNRELARTIDSTGADRHQGASGGPETPVTALEHPGKGDGRGNRAPIRPETVLPPSTAGSNFPDGYEVVPFCPTDTKRATFVPAVDDASAVGVARATPRNMARAEPPRRPGGTLRADAQYRTVSDLPVDLRNDLRGQHAKLGGPGG